MEFTSFIKHWSMLINRELKLELNPENKTIKNNSSKIMKAQTLMYELQSNNIKRLLIISFFNISS